MAINRSFNKNHIEHAERIEFNQEYIFRSRRHFRKREGAVNTAIKLREREVKIGQKI